MDRIKWAIAWWVPKWLVYLCSIRMGTHASYMNPEQEVPSIKLLDALEEWRKLL